MNNQHTKKSIITLSEMLYDRGDVKESEMLASLLLEDKNVFNIDLGKKYKIIYNLNPRFKTNDIKKLLEEDFENYIIVVGEKISSTNLKSIQDIRKDAQVFEIAELSFNISKHSLVPKHILINNEDEIKKITENYQLRSRYQFPVIFRMDPMAKYLNAKPGNLVTITRYSPSAGEHVVYRCCL